MVTNYPINLKDEVSGDFQLWAEQSYAYAVEDVYPGKYFFQFLSVLAISTRLT